jgi:hypothetical protein
MVYYYNSLANHYSTSTKVKFLTAALSAAYCSKLRILLRI